MAERAFIAEDNGAHARTVLRALRPRFHFVQAPDARSARRLLRRRLDYRLFVFDVHLPLTLRASRAPTSTETLDAIASWHLSPTQRRVLACLLDGKTPEETRVLLGLGERTYESHVRQILAKAARTGLRFTRILALVHFLSTGRASNT